MGKVRKPRLFTLFVAFTLGIAAPFVAVASDFKSGYCRTLLDPSGGTDVRYFAGDPNRAITFGLEIELNVADNPKLVNHYRIPGMTDEQWLALPQPERLRLAREREAEVLRSYKAVAYEKLRGAPVKLPEKLLSETNGNVEMNGLVFAKLVDAAAFLDEFEEAIGPAALQGHVVAPKSGLPGATGYTIFEADANQLRTLENGYARHLQDPKVVPGKSLTHHSLAPLYLEDVNVFKDFEGMLERGEPIPFVPDAKGLNAPVLRGGEIYGGQRFGFEGRQFHRRSVDLVEWMERLSRRLSEDGDLSRFAIFETAGQIEKDLVAKRAKEIRAWFPDQADAAKKFGFYNWAPFEQRLGKWVREQVPQVGYGERDTGLRYAFPLRPWAEHPVLAVLPLAEKEIVSDRIHRATLSYLEALHEIAEASAGLTGPEALRRIQIASAKWAYETQLSQYFGTARKTWQAKTGTRTSNFLKTDLPFATKSRATRAVDGTPMRRIDLGADVEAKAGYGEFLDETVEILYVPTVPYGHVSLRVGRMHFGLNYVNWSVVESFAIGKARPVRGAVYKVGRAKIAAAMEEIQKFFASAGKQDLPPFDPFSKPAKVVEIGDGGLKLVSEDAVFPYSRTITGTIESTPKGLRLRGADGYSVPIRIENGEKWIDSYSCSTSISLILARHFGIGFEKGISAKDLDQILQAGNPKGALPDLLVDYARDQ